MAPKWLPGGLRSVSWSSKWLPGAQITLQVHKMVSWSSKMASRSSRMTSWTSNMASWSSKVACCSSKMASWSSKMASWSSKMTSWSTPDSSSWLRTAHPGSRQLILAQDKHDLLDLQNDPWSSKMYIKTEGSELIDFGGSASL